MATQIETPYPVFTDIDGSPLMDGYVYIGVSGLNPETNPVNTYWDEALSSLVTQPVRTIDGFASNSGAAGRLFITGKYSIRVKNKNGTIVFTALNAYGVATIETKNQMSVIMEYQPLISANYTLSSGSNGVSAETVAVASGVTVTVPSIFSWRILA